MRIEVRDGAQSRAAVRPLFSRVYPDAVLQKMIWRDVVSAPAEQRVVVLDDDNNIVAAAALIFRTGLQDGVTVHIGGIGGVFVSPERQRQGLGRMAMLAAHDIMRSRASLQFGLLFCEPHNADFYSKIGWRRFDGEVRVDQPTGPIAYDILGTMTLGLATAAPTAGAIDLCGLPW